MAFKNENLKNVNRTNTEKYKMRKLSLIVPIIKEHLTVFDCLKSSVLHQRMRQKCHKQVLTEIITITAFLHK